MWICRYRRLPVSTAVRSARNPAANSLQKLTPLWGAIFLVASILMTIGATGLKAQGRLNVSPSTADFGSVSLGGSRAISITLKNSGSMNVMFSRESVEGVEFKVIGFTLPLTLEAGKELTLIVQFTPQSLGNSAGTLVLESNASNGTVYVPLDGTGFSRATDTSVLGTPFSVDSSNGRITTMGPTQAAGTVPFDAIATSPVNRSEVSSVVTSAAGITLVQHTSRDAGVTTSAALEFKSSNITGDWIGVCIRGGSVNETFTVRDSRGNTYHKALQFNETGDGNSVGIFYAENIGGGANTITVAQTISSTLRFAVLEYSGVARSGSLDTTAMAQGKSATPDSGIVTTRANGDLLLGAIMTSDAGTYTAGSGFKMEENVPTAPNAKLIVEDQIKAGSGAVAATALLPEAEFWGASLAAFKPAGHPEIAIVQENSRDAGTTTSSALAFELNNTAGNWIGVCVRVGAENANISVADSNGNKYRKAIEFNETADGNTIGIFYAENISKGANAVTVSDKMSQSLRFAILEYSGVAISGSLDVTATAQGKSASPKTGGAVTTANGDLLLGVVMTSDAESYTASSGYSIKEHVPGEPNTKLIAEDQIQVGAGTAAVSTYLGGTDIWAAGLAAFKAAGNEEGTSANFSATPASALFAGVPVGTSDSQSIQFRNLATSNVTITGLEIQGTGFGTLGLVAPLTIAAGGTTTFNIIFSPRSPGTFGGLLTLPVSGSASGLVIPLVGSAVAATRALSGNPTSVKFGNVGVNGFTTANVALLNTGNSSITIQGTTSNGTGFSASGISTRTSIAPSETAMLTVEFAPKSAGSVTGAITISTSASTTLTIPVTGTGITSTASNHVVQLNWAASASASTVGYNVYRSTVSGGPYVKMVSAPVNGTSYSDQTVKAEVEYYYVVTAIAADGLESSRSNQSTAYIP